MEDRNAVPIAKRGRGARVGADEVAGQDILTGLANPDSGAIVSRDQVSPDCIAKIVDFDASERVATVRIPGGIRADAISCDEITVAAGKSDPGPLEAIDHQPIDIAVAGADVQAICICAGAAAV